MITEINFSNLDLLKILFELQKASYKVEADLIQFYEIPPLKESFEDFRNCGETFIGFFEDDELAGAISFTIEYGELTICRVVVHPSHFRKGIALKLLNYVEGSIPQITSYRVSTGKDNVPAKSLYLKNGYQLVGDIEVAPNFYISHFEKRKVV